MRGGKRPGAGRPKGSNKERQERIRGLIARAARVKDADAWLIGLMVKEAETNQATREFLWHQINGRAPLAVAFDQDDGPLQIEIIRKELNTGAANKPGSANVPPGSKGPAGHPAK